MILTRTVLFIGLAVLSICICYGLNKMSGKGRYFDVE